QGLTKDKVAVRPTDYAGALNRLLISFGMFAGRFFPARSLMKWQEAVAIANNHKRTTYKCVFSYPYSWLNRLIPAHVTIRLKECFLRDITSLFRPVGMNS